MRQDGVSVFPCVARQSSEKLLPNNGSWPFVARRRPLRRLPAAPTGVGCTPAQVLERAQWRLRRARRARPHIWRLHMVRRYRLLGVWFHRYSRSALRSALKRANAAWSSSRPRNVLSVAPRNVWANILGACFKTNHGS